MPRQWSFAFLRSLDHCASGAHGTGSRQMLGKEELGKAANDRRGAASSIIGSLEVLLECASKRMYLQSHRAEMEGGARWFRTATVTRS